MAGEQRGLIALQTVLNHVAFTKRDMLTYFRHLTVPAQHNMMLRCFDTLPSAEQKKLVRALKAKQKEAEENRLERFLSELTQNMHSDWTFTLISSDGRDDGRRYGRAHIQYCVTSPHHVTFKFISILFTYDAVNDTLLQAVVKKGSGVHNLTRDQLGVLFSCSTASIHQTVKSMLNRD